MKKVLLLIGLISFCNSSFAACPKNLYLTPTLLFNSTTDGAGPIEVTQVDYHTLSKAIKAIIAAKGYTLVKRKKRASLVMSMHYDHGWLLNSNLVTAVAAEANIKDIETGKEINLESDPNGKNPTVDNYINPTADLFSNMPACQDQKTEFAREDRA